MMSDQMMRRLKVHLTTTMDSVLRTAVFEVMKIFQNALCDHQMEMAMKEEEVAQLKIKLQTAELKLKDLPSECPGRVKINQTQTEPEVVLDAPGPTSEVSEIEHEVPEDWCAPLGCELVTNEDEDVCPSIRLRAFSIPLWHTPIRNHEVHDSDNNLQSTSRGKRSRRISALNERGKLPASVQEGPHGPIRSDVKVLLQGIKRQNSDQNALEGFGKRQKRVNVTAKEPENTEKPKEDQIKSTAGKSKSPEAKRVENAKKMKCRVCKKGFYTKSGREEHERFHKTCRGCKEVFRYYTLCKLHKRRCDKYLLKISPRKEKSSPAPCKDVNEESLLHSPGNDGERATIKYGCTYCNRKFDLSSKLAEHVSHAHEKPLKQASILSKSSHEEESAPAPCKDANEESLLHSPGNDGERATIKYGCTYCNRKFDLSSKLAEHVSHAHEKPLKQASILSKSSHEEESAPAPCKDANEESLLHSPGNDGEKATIKYGCTYCNRKFDLSSNLEKHIVRFHEKPFICSMCPMKFHLSRALCMHMTRKHNTKLKNSVDVNADLEWTKPLEDINGKDSVSPSKDPAKI
ncbi:uncharacterized protein PAE49_014093 isoform 1-T3 [Odontesthes bonariensis]|uniref:uncharacterized protein LOC142397773 n=1 Tax=Odontesthes bonariensis TaxID=219752 RepID=UPI003F58C192